MSKPMSVEELRKWRRRHRKENTTDNCGLNFDDEPVAKKQDPVKTPFPGHDDENKDGDPIELTELFSQVH